MEYIERLNQGGTHEDDSIGGERSSCSRRCRLEVDAMGHTVSVIAPCYRTTLYTYYATVFSQRLQFNTHLTPNVRSFAVVLHSSGASIYLAPVEKQPA